MVNKERGAASAATSTSVADTWADETGPASVVRLASADEILAACELLTATFEPRARRDVAPAATVHAIGARPR